MCICSPQLLCHIATVREATVSNCTGKLVLREAIVHTDVRSVVRWTALLSKKTMRTGPRHEEKNKRRSSTVQDHAQDHARDHACLGRVNSHRIMSLSACSKSTENWWWHSLTARGVLREDVLTVALPTGSCHIRNATDYSTHQT